MSYLRCARIQVKWGGSSKPPSVVVSEGDRRFVIQLWWEVQPQMMSERAMKELEKGDVPRGEEGVSTRVGECLKALEHYGLKVTEGTEGIKSSRERKSTSVEFLQTEEAEPVLGPDLAFSEGPTLRTKGRGRPRGGNQGQARIVVLTETKG